MDKECHDWDSDKAHSEYVWNVTATPTCLVSPLRKNTDGDLSKGCWGSTGI